MRKNILNEEGAAMGGMDAPLKVVLPTVAHTPTGGGVTNITYNIDNSVRTWNGGSFIKDGLGWFKTNWKAIAIAAGTAALIAGLIALISKLTKSIKLRYNKCVRVLARAQHDFTLNENGLDMKAVMPGVGSSFADKASYFLTRIFRGKSSRSTNSNNNIGLHPFCNKFITEVNDDYTCATNAFSKIKLAADESNEGGNSSESYNGKVYNSFREAIMSDYITEGVDGKQHVDESVLAMVSAGISLSCMAVKAGRFIFSKKNKDGKTEEKAVQVTKESTREICYAIINNYADKYINMEQVYKKLGIDTKSLADIDKSSCDKLGEILQKYSKPEANAYTKQYARVKGMYDTMLKHYYNIGYGIINNFKKYTVAKDEKHENLLVSANEKLLNMWDSQKDTYDNNFSHIIIEITSSEPYQNYLNFIVEKVIPVFKSGIAGDADYVLDTYPRKGELYVVRQSLAQDNLPDGQSVQLKGKAAIACVQSFDFDKKEITFSLIGGIEEGDYNVDDHGIASVNIQKIDYDAYKSDEGTGRVIKLSYPKWLALDPCLTNESSIMIFEPFQNNDGKGSFVAGSNVSSIMSSETNININQIMNIVFIIGNGGDVKPQDVINIKLKEPISQDDWKKLIEEHSDLGYKPQDQLPSADKVKGLLTAGQTSAIEDVSYEELPDVIEKLKGGNYETESNDVYTSIYERDVDGKKEYICAVGAENKEEKGEEEKGEEKSNPTDKATSLNNGKTNKEQEQNNKNQSGTNDNSDVNDSLKILYGNALFEDDEPNVDIDDTKKDEDNTKEIFTTVMFVREGKDNKKVAYAVHVDKQFSGKSFEEKISSFESPFKASENQDEIKKTFIGLTPEKEEKTESIDNIDEIIKKFVSEGGEDNDEEDVNLDDIENDEKSSESKTITQIYVKEIETGDNKKFPLFAIGYSNINVESINTANRHHLNDDINESFDYLINEGFSENIKNLATNFYNKVKSWKNSANDKQKDSAETEAKDDAVEIAKSLKNEGKTWKEIKSFFKGLVKAKGTSIRDVISDAFSDWSDVFKQSGVDYNENEDKEGKSFDNLDVENNDDETSKGRYNVIRTDDENAKDTKVSGIILSKFIDGNYVGIKFNFNNESTVVDVNKTLSDNGFSLSDRYKDAKDIDDFVDKMEKSINNNEKTIDVETFGEELKKFENGESEEGGDTNVNYDDVTKKISDTIKSINGYDKPENYASIPSLGEDGKNVNGPNVYAIKADMCPGGELPIKVSMGVKSDDGKDISVLVVPVMTHDDGGKIGSTPVLVMYVLGQGGKLYRQSSTIEDEDIKHNLESLVDAAKNGKEIKDEYFDKNIAVEGGNNSADVKAKIEADIKTLSGMIEFKKGNVALPGKTQTSADVRNAEERKTANNGNVMGDAVGNESLKILFKNSLDESLSPEMLALKQAYALSMSLNEDDNNQSQNSGSGWVLKSGKQSEENGNVNVESNNGALKVTFTDVYYEINGKEDFFSFYIQYNTSDNKTYAVSVADGEVKSEGFNVVAGEAMTKMCTEVVDGLQKKYADKFKFTGGETKPQTSQQPQQTTQQNDNATQASSTKQTEQPETDTEASANKTEEKPNKTNSSLEITYNVDDAVYESNESNVSVSRYINKQGEGWFVVSEAYYDDGYGYKSKLENSSYRNSLKTREDFTKFAKSFVNAKMDKLDDEMNFNVVSAHGYKPSVITPLCECLMVVKFNSDDSVKYKHYLGKRIILK